MKSYPLRISVLYFMLALLWIFLSDWFVATLIPASFLSTAQTIKGFSFVLITACILFFVSKHYYKRIERNEREYRQLFKDNPHPMYVYDTTTLKFLTVNDAAVEKYKYTREEFRQMNMTQIRPPEERDSILMFLKRIEDKPFHDSGIWKHMDKYGKEFFARIASHSTTFGQHEARVVLAIDIDEQIQAQRKVQLSEDKLNGLINNSDDLIWMISSKGQIVTANAAFKNKFRQFLGFEVDLSQSIDVSQLPNTGLTENWTLYFNEAFAGKSMKVEQEVKNENSVEYYEIILNPIVNEKNEIFGVGCFARDITQRKESENRIKKQVERLKEVAWIQSHEVRRPLANIMGLIELLRQTQEEKEKQELFDHMEQSCKELDAVIKKVVTKSSTGDTLT